MKEHQDPGFRPRFFASGEPAGDPVGAEFVLDRQDSHHARTVLRLQPGDECEVVIGAAVYAATVTGVGDRVMVRVREHLEEAAGGAYRVSVGLIQALTRPAVMDYVFEKATEVGVSFFLLVSAAGSPRWASPPPPERLERWSRIAREAAKQSKQLMVPPVVFAGSVEQALEHPQVVTARSLVLQPEAPSSLAELVADMPVASGHSDAVVLWVGPEGGWAADELRAFRERGMMLARLGRSVLRTETAGPVSVAVTRVTLKDW